MKMRIEESTPWTLRVPAGKKFIQVQDTETIGMVVRRYASGRCVVAARYEAHGREGFTVLRDLVQNTKWLAIARKEVLDARGGARKGIDPAKEARAARAEIRAQGETIGKLAEVYMAERSEGDNAWKPRYRQEVERHLTRDWAPLAKKPIRSVTREMIVQAADKIADKQGRFAADRACAALSGLFTWAVQRCKIEHHPMMKMEKRGGDAARGRTLTPDELADLWAATFKLGNTAYASIVRLLILTGCRRDEVGQLQWDWVNDDLKRLELPGGVDGATKNRRVHWVPLSPLALKQLPERPDPKDPGRRTTVFGRRHHHGYSGWSKARAELDVEIGKIRRRRSADEMKPWRLHDLRHTFATLAREQKLGDVHLLELAINHISGSRGGIAGKYDHSERIEDRVELYAKWARYVESLVKVAAPPRAVAAAA
jgi:integrase